MVAFASGSLVGKGAGKIPIGIYFHKDMVLPGHPNAMRFTAIPGHSVVYYSTGGGFIQREGETQNAADAREPVAFPFQSAAQLLDYGSDLWQMSLDEFEHKVALRFFTSPEAIGTEYEKCPLLDDATKIAWEENPLSPEELAAFEGCH